MKTLVDLEKVYELNPEVKRDAVRNLLGWAEEQPHLPKITGRYKILLSVLGVDVLFAFTVQNYK